MAIRQANGATTSGAIDKLDLRVHRGTGLRKAIQDIVNRKADLLARRANKRYHRVIDLRGWGLKAILHLRNRVNADHKIEIVGVGEMTFSEMITEISQIVDVDPFQLEIMRIDLAVDIPGYTVEWFRNYARVDRKRNTAEYGHYVAVHERSETLYFGARPNQIRIYDKIGQLRREYYLESRRNPGQPLPTFEQVHGFPENGFILTRVERQCGGKRIPAQVKTVQNLFANAASFDPFESLRFQPITISQDSVNRLSGREFVDGNCLLNLIRNYGFHEAKRRLDVSLRRNTARFLGRLQEVLATDYTNRPPELFETYRKAVTLQLASS